MTFRVTTLSMTAQALRAARQHTRLMAISQEQLSTGLRINRPSDDPVGLRSVLSYRTDELRLQSDNRNIQAARVKLDTGVTRLLEAKDLLVSAKSILLESSTTFERDILAEQVDQVWHRMVRLGNAQFGDEFLFAGTALTTKPFETVGTDQVRYLGTDQRESMVVGVGLTVDTIYAGSEVFHNQSRQPTTFVGFTGAAPGSGTNSGVGRQVLSVSHTTTTILGTSGITAGLSSAAKDTIVGPPGAYQLEIHDTSGDGSSGTVSLNGGPEVNFTAADVDLRIEGPEGQVVFLDTSNVAVGFSGVVDLQANGELSIDGGAATVPITFSENDVVIDSLSGGVTHVDSRNIRSTGTEFVDHAGTASVFDVLTHIRNDLRDTELPESEWQQRIQSSIGELDRYVDHFLAIVGDQSATLENLDSLEFRNEDVQLELQRIKTEIEGADVTEAVIQLQSTQNLLQYTYASTSRIFELSLLNYL